MVGPVANGRHLREGSAGSDDRDVVRRTVYNESTGLFDEELVPLRVAYNQAIHRLDEIESEDMKVQRDAWRKGIERADAFQQTVTGMFESTIGSARTTYRLLTAMSITLFVTGLGLFVFAALYGALANEKSYALVFAGLGASTFVALFIMRPFNHAQVALSNMVQSEMAFMAFFEQIRMWANYPWVSGALDPKKVEKASRVLHERTLQSMEDFQHYVEPASSPADDDAVATHDPDQ